jgi:dTDP-4-dehydrorhamnose reductase
MNIMVTGSDGQLGSEFRVVAERSPQLNFFYFNHHEFDICDAVTVTAKIRECKCDVLINCAAFTSVDKAEEDSSSAYRVNRDGAAVLARCAKEQNILLVHFSTYYVFDGLAAKPYMETDEVRPIGVYAQSKFEGEELIRNSGSSYIIIRTGWLYSLFGQNFVKTMLMLSGERESLSVVSDRVGSPTYARDLAAAVLSILAKVDLKKTYAATYHYSNEGVCSWYDFAVAIMLLSKSLCRVMSIESSAFPVSGPRPQYSVLNNSLIKKDWALDIPHWQASLSEMLETSGLEKGVME